MKLKLLTYFCLAIIFLQFACKDDPVKPPPPPPEGSITIDYEPAWSPDGHTIAYFHNDTSLLSGGIYLIDTNGINKRLLINGFVSSPDFSPTGEWVVFEYSGRIAKIKTNGDSLTILTSGGNNFYPSWSPDGEWIAYDYPFVGPYNIWKMKADSSDKIGLAYDSRMPSWSPNGNNIVHVRYFSNNDPWEIAIMDSAGKNTIRITFDNAEELYPRYSPDGQKIIFTRNFQIYTINTDGSGLIRLTDTQGYSADYSPNGEKIVYCNSADTNGRLWIMNKDGTNKKQLTFP